MASLKQIISKKDYSFFLNADRNTIFAAAIYFACFCLFEFFTLKTGFFEFVKYLDESQNYVFAAFCGAYFVLAMYFAFLFILMTLASKWRYKILYLAFLLLALTAEYSYQKALGRFALSSDISSIIGTNGEQKFDSFLSFFSVYALLPFVVLAILCVFFKKQKSEFGGKSFVAFTLVSCLFYFHLSFINQGFIDRRIPTVSLASFSQTLADYLQHGDLFKTKIKREKLEPINLPENSRPTNNIVLVFDESVRGDHLSLNGYERPTTPYLEELNKAGLLKNWGIAVSAATSSRPSFDAFLAGATPQMLNKANNQDTINALPSIFQYAKAMNYKTHYFDGQMKTYWSGMPEDTEFIDNLQTMSELDSPNRKEDYELGKTITNQDNKINNLKTWEIDNKIARIVNETITNSTGNFIFIYKRGVHFPYEKNYPETETHWTPIFRFKEQWEIPPAEQKQAVINSYDNSIRYNLDSFFKNIASDYANLPNKTTIIYTSDHGESFEGNGKAPHGGKSPEEAAIPLFILGSLENPVDTTFKASHNNLFSALLDLMKYPETMRKTEYGISLLKAKKSDSGKRFYNPDLGEKIPFE
jgi:glucan phosphoethanolaminetransferase (alkaline phosphatase superfamily)